MFCNGVSTKAGEFSLGVNEIDLRPDAKIHTFKM